MEVFGSDIHQVFVKLLDGNHRVLNFDPPSNLLFPVVVHLLLRLRGGEGGFGSLLRGAATKVGQKKTNNFDAWKDMNGRRMRHVNAERRLEEWSAEAEEMKLEKMADDFIKAMEVTVPKKYVAKYNGGFRRESIEGLVSSKRKGLTQGNESVSKRLKIWRVRNGSNSDSSKEAEASSGSLGRDKSLDGRVHDSNSKKRNNPVLESLEKHVDHNEVVLEVPNKSCSSSKVDEIVSQQPGISGAENKAVSAAVENSCKREAIQEESVPATENLQNLNNPIKFDEYNSAAELEVLGLARLKSELQAQGLKCGGTLQERAARLFLLKTTPLEMLPKKLFAKR
ncbi:hypothetical protein ACP275_02G188800 [Erythranthe tilingii]